MSDLGIWHLEGAAPGEVTDAALELADEGVEVTRPGAGPGSLEEAGLHYFVVDGLVMRRRNPGNIIRNWIHDEMLSLASACTGVALALSTDVRTAINVNVLRGRGERYELHTDPCTYSALVFASGPHSGGQWHARPYESVSVEVSPIPGDLVIFRGSIPHCVLPLEDESTRISVPVALYPLGQENITRDPALDAHIFGEESHA